MGLDAAELIMEIEKTFGITFPERADPPVIATVGDLYQFILERLAESKTETTRCLSAAIFYQFRRALLASPSLGLSRPQVHPGARMDDLFPERGRRQQWAQLGELLRWRLPELVRPSWVLILFFVLLLAWLAAIVIIWWVRGGVADDMFLLIPALVLGSMGSGTAHLSPHPASGQALHTPVRDGRRHDPGHPAS